MQLRTKGDRLLPSSYISWVVTIAIMMITERLCRDQAGLSPVWRRTSKIPASRCPNTRTLTNHDIGNPVGGTDPVWGWSSLLADLNTELCTTTLLWNTALRLIGSARLSRQALSLDGNAVHQAAFAVVVVEGPMPRCPIIPKGNRSGLPFKTIGKFGPCGVDL